MGMRGPIGKPTAIEIAEGRPGKRAINHREPQPLVVTPKMPKYLDARAKAEWRRLCPILERMSVLTEADYLALGQLCQTVSRLEQAEVKLAQSGLLYKSPRSNYVMASPLLSIVNTCNDQLTRWLTHFGLTPASRARMMVVPAQPEMDDIDASFGRPVQRAS
jgi:P27 family predicted phage terminase small subunit